MPEVETSDPTECEFVDSHTGYGWDPSTMLSGTAFHGPTGQTHAITKDCWAGAGVITLLRVIAAGGWDDAKLARSGETSVGEATSQSSVRADGTHSVDYWAMRSRMPKVVRPLSWSID